jgi:hypothetical protein
MEAIYERTDMQQDQEKDKLMKIWEEVVEGLVLKYM